MKFDVDEDFIKVLCKICIEMLLSLNLFFRRIIGIRGLEDLFFFSRAVKFVFGHIVDFKAK